MGYRGHRHPVSPLTSLLLPEFPPLPFTLYSAASWKLEKNGVLITPGPSLHLLGWGCRKGWWAPLWGMQAGEPGSSSWERGLEGESPLCCLHLEANPWGGLSL